MRFILNCFIIVAVVCIANATTLKEFESWMQLHNKHYATNEEKMYRMSVFEENVRRINAMNSESNRVQYGINAFADRTMDELRKSYTSRSYSKSMKAVEMNHVVAPRAKVDKLPKEFNWVDRGAVTSVKDQGDCGSCFAFGAVGTMEGQLFLRKGKLVNLSEQNILDCDHECQVFPDIGKMCDEACDGGMEPNVFQWVIKNGGINLLDDYPYKAKKGKCRFDKSKAVGGFRNWTYVTVEYEDDLRQYLYDNGPVSVGVHAEEWFYYSGGIFDSKCQTENDHAVLLTGWGEASDGTPYWIIKNSWGTSWGMNGYIYLIRGKNKCGILELMSQIHF